MERLTPGLVAEIACAADSWAQVESSVLTLLEVHVGADALFFVDDAGPTAASRGVIAGALVELRRQWARLGTSPGVAHICQAALQGNGVVVDSELFGTALSKQDYFESVMRPVRGTTTMFALIPFRGPSKHEMILGRCQGAPAFTEQDTSAVAALLPTLALARAALQVSPRVAASCRELWQQLTPREKEVISYLHLGYTNSEIGLALGTRERTVRNQLSHIYSKLGVANRAEVVGLVAASALNVG